MAAGTWSWPVKITSFSSPYPPTPAFFFYPVTLCCWRTLCTCAALKAFPRGGTGAFVWEEQLQASIRKRRLTHSGGVGSGGQGDTFDYLLVLAQENHCHVQEFIQQNSFQRQFLIVARKESTFLVQKKKEDVFFIVRGFFLFFLFFLPRLLMEASSTRIFSFPSLKTQLHCSCMFCVYMKTVLFGGLVPFVRRHLLNRNQNSDLPSRSLSSHHSGMGGVRWPFLAFYYLPIQT